ncbi:MAG: cystathionine gamma-synthase [Myxococcales bacterium]|nr:cystathionine gamma-synthase [Myxococcales bacterium]MCB9651332.1 cystathionine gamma-synthase [Deltaproteobacteria bacterium]
MPPVKHRIETLAIHAGCPAEKITGAVNVPIFQTSTYAQHGPGDHTGFEYSRTQNPTRFALQDNLAALENGKHGLSFASGCAATDTVLHCLSAGDHVVSGDDVYGGTFRLFDKVHTRHGLSFTYVPAADVAAYAAAIRPETKLIWLETPTNPMLTVADIEAICAIGRAKGIPVVVDNTFATPYLQRPLDLGATMVVHSVTKYLGGHSDVVGGAIITNDDAWRERLAFVQNSAGAVPGPFDCFLTLRGTKTLHVRMDRHCDNAEKVVEMLVGHEKVEKVIYPGLESHPQHAIAKKQMRRYGGMISFVIKGGMDASRRFLQGMEVFTLAESLGGVESLIEHPAIMTHASIPKEMREARGIDDGLIRISVGIESVEDLKDDLRAALARA